MRISQVIEHKVKKTFRQIRRLRGWAWLLLLVVIFGGVITPLIYYFERADMAMPLKCKTLIFASNKQLCNERLEAHLASSRGLDLAPVCAKDREAYGSTRCGEYDEARAAFLFTSTLEEQGISLWEPRETIPSNGSFIVKITQEISSLNLVCNQEVIPIRYGGVRDRITVSYNRNISGICKLTARIAEGSITSKEFSVSS